MITIILLSLAALSAVAILVLNYRKIIEWFIGRRQLKESDKNNIAFTVQQKLKNGHFKTVQGIFNTNTNQVVDGKIYESENIDKDLKEIHRNDELVVYN